MSLFCEYDFNVLCSKAFSFKLSSLFQEILSLIYFVYFVVLFLLKIWLFFAGYWELFCSYFKLSFYQVWLLKKIHMKKYLYINILICKLNLCFSIPFFFILEVIYFFHLWCSSSSLFLVQVDKYDLEIKNQIVLCKFFYFHT